MRRNKPYTKVFKQECVQYMHNNLSMTFASFRVTRHTSVYTATMV